LRQFTILILTFEETIAGTANAARPAAWRAVEWFANLAVAARGADGATTYVQYYLLNGEEVLGPLEPADLLKRTGFGAESVICPIGSTSPDDWRPAESYPEFRKVFAPSDAPVQAPPPPPPPPPPKARPPSLPSVPRSTPPPATRTNLPPPPRPMPPATRRPATAPPSRAGDAPPTDTASRLAAGPKPLVLLVDDEADVCEIMRTHLQKAGMRTVVSYNGIDASAKLTQERPRLIVLDLMMPGQNGFELLRSMEASGHGNIPVVVITARRLDSAAEELLRQSKNVVEFFTKPFDMVKFAESVRRHVAPVDSGD
jgi:CheY-like chemotaxis protein